MSWMLTWVRGHLCCSPGCPTTWGRIDDCFYLDQAGVTTRGSYLIPDFLNFNSMGLITRSRNGTKKRCKLEPFSTWWPRHCCSIPRYEFRNTLVCYSRSESMHQANHLMQCLLIIAARRIKPVDAGPLVCWRHHSVTKQSIFYFMNLRLEGNPLSLDMSPASLSSSVGHCHALLLYVPGLPEEDRREFRRHSVMSINTPTMILKQALLCYF
jgi:hypothetical protein